MNVGFRSGILLFAAVSCAAGGNTGQIPRDAEVWESTDRSNSFTLAFTFTSNKTCTQHMIVAFEESYTVEGSQIMMGGTQSMRFQLAARTLTITPEDGPATVATRFDRSDPKSIVGVWVSENQMARGLAYERFTENGEHQYRLQMPVADRVACRLNGRSVELLQDGAVRYRGVRDAGKLLLKSESGDPDLELRQARWYPMLDEAQVLEWAARVMKEGPESDE